jgi:hypothetical protein
VASSLALRRIELAQIDHGSRKLPRRSYSRYVRQNVSLLWIAPVTLLLWARSSRVALALVVSMVPTWTLAALGHQFVMGSDDISVALLFLFVVLPFVLAPVGSVIATVILGPPRAFFVAAMASIAGCLVGVFWLVHASAVGVPICESFRDMAVPVTLALCAALFAATLARRRVS